MQKNVQKKRNGDLLTVPFLQLFIFSLQAFRESRSISYISFRFRRGKDR